VQTGRQENPAEKNTGCRQLNRLPEQSRPVYNPPEKLKKITMEKILKFFGLSRERLP
jgi:hypothetical protein